MIPANANVPTFKKGERLAAGKLNKLAALVAGILRSRFGFGVSDPLHIQGKLDGELAKATAFDTDPATATMSVWIRNSAGDLIDSGRNETIVNRFIHMGPFSTGTIVRAEWLDGEWAIYAADCEA